MRALLPGLAAATALATACAGVEKGRYGVDELELEGMEQMAPRALARCLLTMERGSFGVPIGLTQSECNAPPFDSSTPRIDLWSWPWTDWPVLNPAVLEVDRQRIERWYRARGFYDARVVQIRYEPPEAGAVEPTVPPGHCDPQREECTVEITIVIDEGMPLRVGELALEGLEGLPAQARAEASEAELPRPGARFDEFDYDRGKQALLERLAEVSYAAATVTGEVRLDHTRKLAHVRYRVVPGPPYRFGEVRVEGNAALPASPIRAAAAVDRGQPYRQSALREVQQEVYAMGAFSAVDVERVLDPSARLVHLRVKVTPLPYDAFRLGVGVTSGALQRTATGLVEPVPQWDIHLLARYERRHVLGTLGKLRIEDRPRRIFQDDFPKLIDPEWGNVLRVRLNQPGVIEARTDLIFESQWDYGPDPFLRFTRHDVILRVAAQRAFLRRLLFATLGVQHDRFIVPDEDAPTSTGELPPDSYVFSFVEQDLRLDLRDDAVQPRSGLYLGVLASESVRNPASDWTAFRVLPEVRGYVPLPFHMVLAGRFAVGALFVTDARSDLDDVSWTLGPTNYRLRGGGAQSNRGFGAGELGVGLEGGLRRWESALELRIRLGESFGVVGFFDMGNVTREGARRRAPPPTPPTPPPTPPEPESGLFGRANPAAGFGLRYLTVVGAIRFDVGFRLGDVGEVEEDDKLLLFESPGAMHLTIGEAF